MWPVINIHNRSSSMVLSNRIMISTNAQILYLDDGKAFIDIATEGYEGGLDISTWMKIRQAANDIIQRCVTQSVPKCGTVAGLGKYHAVWFTC